MSKRKVRVHAAWIEGNKLRCSGVCEDVELDFVAAVVGQPDKDGRVWTKESMQVFLQEIKGKIEKGEI